MPANSQRQVVGTSTRNDPAGPAGIDSYLEHGLFSFPSLFMALNIHLRFDASGHSKARKRKPTHFQQSKEAVSISLELSTSSGVHLSFTHGGSREIDTEAQRQFHSKVNAISRAVSPSYDPGWNQDTFNFLLTLFSGYLPGAMDYFLLFYAPTSLVPPDITAENQDLVPRTPAIISNVR